MATLNFIIKNSTSISDDDIQIWFGGDIVTGTLNSNQTLDRKKWYKLSDIQKVELTKIIGGRVYVYYGNNPNFSPETDSVIAPGSDAYLKCFDKFELTFDGSPFAVADLTAIDFWSIPMNLATTKTVTDPNGNKRVIEVGKLQAIKSGSTTQQLFASLSKLSDPVQSAGTGKNVIQAFADAGHALPAGIVSQINAPASGLIVDGSTFVRIVGPNSYPPFGDPAKNLPPGLPFTPYNTFEDYIQFLVGKFGPGQTPGAPFSQLGNGKIANLKGSYAGSNAGSGAASMAQAYDLWAAIDNDANLTITGTGGQVGNIKMQVDKWNLLNPAATYGGDPSFSLNGGPLQSPENNLYAWIWGDFFAGLNIGAIGSEARVNIPGATGGITKGVVVGEMASSDWFKFLPKQNKLFNQLWPLKIKNHWNQWAQVLNPVSEAYNFAYAERFSAPQLGLNPAEVDTLELELLPVPSVT